jgi:hypothetical protein
MTTKKKSAIAANKPTENSVAADCDPKSTITVVLNGYRRAANLDEQVDAILAQTVKPAEILVWHNATDSKEIAQNRDIASRTVSAYSNKNFGVWARFAFALNARTEFVAMFDDDTIPGRRWLENCLETMAEREALLGTIGLLYLDPPPARSKAVSYYNPFQKIGWYTEGQRGEAVEVDFVGHAWFFKRAWLSTFWRELPDPSIHLCGEDMHFSFMLQRYLAIPTIVPKHPPGQPEFWGSTSGAVKGTDKHSLWESNPTDGTKQPFRQSMDEWFKKQRRAGWRLVNDR